MPIDTNNIWIYRIIPIENLDYHLQHGLYAKKAVAHLDASYISIGSRDVISRRDNRVVDCYPDSVVNDFVPFYFSVRTPMLFNIVTGRGANEYDQKKIIYLCCKFSELATDDFQWCYTNGNASSAISKFYRKVQNIDTKVDWHSVKTNDFRDANADGDEDRIRKKHSEFLVKDHVPVAYIKQIVVINNERKLEVEKLVEKHNRKIAVKISPTNQFYFQ